MEFYIQMNFQVLILNDPSSADWRKKTKRKITLLETVGLSVVELADRNTLGRSIQSTYSVTAGREIGNRTDTGNSQYN